MADVEFNFEDNRVEIKRAISDAIGAVLLEISSEIVSKAARNTPVDSGQLKGSWKANVDEYKGEAVIGSPLENALWNEFGTGNYALEGKGRLTPWYVPVDGYTGTKKPTYNGQVIIVYGKDGKAFYKTNGKKPQRSLQKAFDSTKKKAQKALENKLKGLK